MKVSIMRRGLLFALMMFFPVMVMARQAHVCTVTVPFQVYGKPYITDKTKLNCPDVGIKTIPELASEGWTISLPLSDSLPQQTVIMMFLIQKP